jgi:hypothetical protein
MPKRVSRGAYTGAQPLLDAIDRAEHQTVAKKVLSEAREAGERLWISRADLARIERRAAVRIKELNKELNRWA